MEEEEYDMMPTIKTENVSEEEMHAITLGYADSDEGNVEYHHMENEYYESGEEDEMEEGMESPHSPFDDDMLMNSENVKSDCSQSTSQLIYNQSPQQLQFVQHHNVELYKSRQILQKRSVVHQKVTVSQPTKKQQMVKRLSDQVDLHMVVPRADSKTVNFRQLTSISPRQQIQQSSLVKVNNQPAQHITASQHTVTQFTQKSPVTTISTSDVRVQRIMSQIKQSEGNQSQHQSVYHQSQVHIKQQQIQRHTHVQQHIQQENINVRSQPAPPKLIPSQGVQAQPQVLYSQQENVRRVVRPTQQPPIQSPQGTQEIKTSNVRPAQQQQQTQPPAQQTSSTNVRVSQVTVNIASPRLPNSTQSQRSRARFPVGNAVTNAKSSNSPAAPTHVKQIRMGTPNILQNKIRPPGMAMNKADNFAAYASMHNGGRPSPVSGVRSPMTPQLPRTPVITNLNRHVTLTSIPLNKFPNQQSFLSQTPGCAKAETSKPRHLMNLKANKFLQEFHDFEVQTNQGNIYLTAEDVLNELENMESSSESEHSGDDSELEKEEREAFEDESSPPSKSPEPQESVKHVDGFYALCTFCGYLSMNFANCERCKRKLPDEIKMVPIGSRMGTNIVITMKENPPPPQPVPPPTPTQLQQVQAKLQPATKQVMETKKPVAPRTVQAQQVQAKLLPATKQVMETKKPVAPRTVQPQVPKKKRVSRKKHEEPECLTISSDEEVADPTSDCSQNMDILRDPAVTTATLLKEPVITDEHESESENITQGVKGGGLPETDIDQLMNESFNSDSAQSEFTHLHCRTVRVGSYKVVPKDLVLLSLFGVKIIVPSLQDSNVSVTLNIPFQEIVRILIHFGKQLPVLFLYITHSAGAEIRKALKMEKKEGHYFDPTSKDETHKRITLLPEKITDDSRAALKKIFSNEDKGANKFEELSSKEANDILVRASPKEVQKALKQTSTSSGADETVRVIMAYPPHPAKEGIMINTQDYACLGEDQFLNDVIIDFYLKYLTLQVLTPEDRERTHVFSSFFYQRLTKSSSKTPKGSKANNDKVSAAKTRHSRVCRWTKKIDLFSKDFIIIPINENSHWFLAIICYPGLESPVSMNDNTPALLMPSVPRRKNKDEMCNSSVTIGSTTITPVAQNSPQTTVSVAIPPEADGKDEAESEDEDISMHSSDEDSSGSNENRSSQQSQQLSGIEAAPIIPTSTPKMESALKVKHETKEPIRQPCILIFDSLAMCNKRSRVVATLRDYLRIEYETKYPDRERKFTKDTFKGASPKVPQQDNFTDCGLFVLQYVESFFECPIEDYSIPIKSLKNWFNPDTVSRKRYQIQQLLHSLMADQNINYKELNLPELNLRPDGLPSKPLVDYSDSNGGDMEGMDDGMEEGMEEGLGEEEDYDDEDLDDELDGEGEEEDESDSALFNSSNSMCNSDKITSKDSLGNCNVSNLSSISNVSNLSGVSNLERLACLKNTRIIRKLNSSNCTLSSSLTITTTTAPSDNGQPPPKKIRIDYDGA